MPFPEHAAQMIRDKLDTGRLPRDVNPRMFAGYGDGQHCDGCEMPISAAQVEWEFITPEGQTSRSPRVRRAVGSRPTAARLAHAREDHLKPPQDARLAPGRSSGTGGW